MKYRCISADSHIDLGWLPPDLFVSNASQSMKERMPYVTDSADGPRWATKTGANLGLTCGVSATGRKYVAGSVYRADRMAAQGLFDEASKASRRLTDPYQRVKDQDRDGVDAEVLYGLLVIANFMNDAEATPELYRIYNEWLAQFCGVFPDRLIGLATLTTVDVDAAIAEVRKARDRGLRGVELACTDDMPPLFDRRWDPLWRAIEEARLGVHFHVTGRPVALLKEWTDAEKRAAARTYTTMNPVTTAGRFVIEMIMGGVLARHPDLRLVLGESGIGWIPYLLSHADYEYEVRQEDMKALGLKQTPSEYWKAQCKATFQFDDIGVRLLDTIGEDTLMWASDFPHSDGVWPDSQEYIAKQFGHLPQATRHKIICGNAVNFYKLQND